MKKVFKKIIGILIVCGLILSGLPSQTAHAADTGISFVLGTNGGSYCHIQTYGDTAGRITYMGGYPTLVLGTTGQAKRLEEIALRLNFNRKSRFRTLALKGTLAYLSERNFFQPTPRKSVVCNKLNSQKLSCRQEKNDIMCDNVSESYQFYGLSF